MAFVSFDTFTTVFGAAGLLVVVGLTIRLLLSKDGYLLSAPFVLIPYVFFLCGTEIIALSIFFGRDFVVTSSFPLLGGLFVVVGILMAALLRFTSRGYYLFSYSVAKAATRNVEFPPSASIINSLLEQLKPRIPVPVVLEAFNKIEVGLSQPLLSIPPMPLRIVHQEGLDYTPHIEPLDNIIHIARNQSIVLKETRNTIWRVLWAICENLPEYAFHRGEEHPIQFQTPLMPTLHIPRLSNEINAALYENERVKEFRILVATREQLGRNNLEVAKNHISSLRRLNEGHRVLPEDHPGPPSKTAWEFLHGTPFTELFDLEVPLPFPQERRFAHTILVAGSDHGKTQTLEAMICRDLLSNFVPGLVVIDSKGDMIPRLAKLDVFHPEHGVLKDRLIIIDPKDEPHLSMFQGNPDDTIGQTKYFFNALLEAELTQSMSGLLYPIMQMLVLREGATLQDIVDCVNDPTPYQDTIAKLPDAPRRFLQEELKTTRTESKVALKNRIYKIQNEVQPIAQMFSAPANMFNMKEAVDSGKIVLINAEQQALKGGYAIFGRYFIAQVLSAAIARTNQVNRRPAFLYVDEAGPFFDETTESILDTMRSYRIGSIIAFQRFPQASVNLRSAIDANTSIKMVGGESRALADTFDSMMNTTSDFIFAQTPRREYGYTRWACHVRTLTNQAVSLHVPFRVLDKLPQMEDDVYRRMREQNKRALQSPTSVAPRPAPVSRLEKKW